MNLSAAGAALGVYVVAAVWLAWQRSAGEPDWTRAVYVVTGIEAVAFAAAGGCGAPRSAGAPPRPPTAAPTTR